MVPQELSTFAKDNNISLVTHSDPEVSSAAKITSGHAPRGLMGHMSEGEEGVKTTLPF